MLICAGAVARLCSASVAGDDSDDMVRIIVLALVVLVAEPAWAQNPPEPGFFADLQMLWFDSPIRGDDYVGTSNTAQDAGGFVEFAPRLIMGYDDTIGARVRWWTYDRSTVIDSPAFLAENKRLNFDVVDLEATTRVRYGGSDLLFAGGARIASIETDTVFPETDRMIHEEAGLGGVTFAAEGRTGIFSNDIWGVSAVYGGRLSLLKAEWDGQATSAFYHQDTNNTRYNVSEAFAGVEARYRRAFSRITVEMQDWEGDRRGLPHHNYGFTGFGFDVGWSF
jgi:hypothetical protein